jgi:hypothetical protein
MFHAKNRGEEKTERKKNLQSEITGAFEKGSGEREEKKLNLESNGQYLST